MRAIVECIPIETPLRCGECDPLLEEAFLAEIKQQPRRKFPELQVTDNRVTEWVLLRIHGSRIYPRKFEATANWKRNDILSFFISGRFEFGGYLGACCRLNTPKIS